jgi:hypothetical protein
VRAGVTCNGTPYRDWLAACPPRPTFSWARCETCSYPMRSDGTACTGWPRHPAPVPTVRFYATLTRTKANLTAMHAEGFRLLVGPDQLADERHLPPLAWALDNGAWGCHQRGADFDGSAFREAMARWGPGADFVVVPDIVGAGLRSLAFSVRWADEVRQTCRRPLYVAVQDGVVPEDVARAIEWFDGVFVGGTTAWKETTMCDWGRFARERGLPLHVGRVNTDRRLRLAIDAGATSVDGTSPSRFACNTPRLARVAAEPRHPSLFPETP